MEKSGKMNTLSIMSFCCGLLVLISLGLYWFLALVPAPAASGLPSGVIDRVHNIIMDVSVRIRNFSAFVAVITGIIALREIKKSDRTEKGKIFAWIGLIIGVVWIIMGLLVSSLFLLVRRMI